MRDKMCFQKELLCTLMLVLALVVGAQSSPLNLTENTESVQLRGTGLENTYYLSVAKANWHKALQFCRYNGMNLVSITSHAEYVKLVKYIHDAGYLHERFWTSGSDQAEEGKFVWMSNGRPLTFTNWQAGEPNNAGGHEDCLELWNKDNDGLKFNDAPCCSQYLFICESEQCACTNGLVELSYRTRFNDQFSLRSVVGS